LTIDLGLDGSVKLARHAGQREFSRESEGRELGVLGIFGADRLKADEIEISIITNRWVGGESDRPILRHVNTVSDPLEWNLLDGVTDVE